MDSPPADEEFVMADDYPAFIPPTPVPVVSVLVEKWFRLVDLDKNTLFMISEFLTLGELQGLKFESGSRYMHSCLKLKIERKRIIIDNERELFFYLYPSSANLKLLTKVQEVSMVVSSDNEITWLMTNMLCNKFKVPKLTISHPRYIAFSGMFSYAACTELNLINVELNASMKAINENFPNLKKLGMFSSRKELNDGYSNLDRSFHSFYSISSCFKQLETILIPSALQLFPTTQDEFLVFDAQFPSVKYFQEYNRIWRKEDGIWIRESEEMELEIKIRCKKRKLTSDPKKKELHYCTACKQRTDAYHLINDSVMCLTCLMNPSSVKTTRELIIQCREIKRAKPECKECKINCNCDVVYQTTTSIVS